MVTGVKRPYTQSRRKRVGLIPFFWEGSMRACLNPGLVEYDVRGDNRDSSERDEEGD